MGREESDTTIGGAGRRQRQGDGKEEKRRGRRKSLGGREKRERQWGRAY